MQRPVCFLLKIMSELVDLIIIGAGDCVGLFAVESSIN